MTDKIVTHADLPVIDTLASLRPSMFRDEDAYQAVSEFLARARAAAEADAPPLPEGWVLLNTTKGRRALWHEDGDLYEHDMLGGGVWIKVAEVDRNRLTPLRPTVTEADVEKGAEAAAVESTAVASGVWGALPEGTQDLWRATARAAFTAAGVEVKS